MRFATPLATLVLVACASPAHAADVTGSITLTSDYVWRGTSQTQGDPAVQAGMKVAADNGLYASAWGSNVEFSPELHASSEFDFNVGWSRKVSDDWTFDVNVLHYRYPSTTTDLDWTELNGTATFRDNAWLSLGWSPEALGTDGNGTYALVGGRWPINDRFRFEGAIAHYFLEESYSHANASVIWMIRAPLELRVTAHATDGDAKTLFGDDLAGHRIEVALQTSL